jgi:transaldolase
MKENSPTVLWNDSADPKELKDALTWGIVGATCNPVIALSAIKADKDHWVGRIKEYAKANPAATDDAIGWAMVKELSLNAAKILEPEFEKYNGRNGRLSIQTDPRNFRNAKALTEQAFEFSKLAKNIIVKIPVTSEAISAFEEATYLGVSLNATVSFSVAQTIAVAEAIERGLKRREEEGLDISDYVSGYDHPDKYIDSDQGGDNPFIKDGGEITRVLKDDGVCILILPWNIKREIIKQLAYVREWKAKFVVAIPRIKIL